MARIENQRQHFAQSWRQFVIGASIYLQYHV